MPKKVQRTEEQQRKLNLLIKNLPRCKRCNQVLIATCDKSKSSQLVQFKGREETKTKSQFMWIFPTAEKQSDFCPYCKDKLHPTKVGKEIKKENES